MKFIDCLHKSYKICIYIVCLFENFIRMHTSWKSVSGMRTWKWLTIIACCCFFFTFAIKGESWWSYPFSMIYTLHTHQTIQSNATLYHSYINYKYTHIYIKPFKSIFSRFFFPSLVFAKIFISFFFFCISFGLYPITATEMNRYI